MKHVIVLIFVFFTVNCVFAQHSGILLIAKEGNKRGYLAENKRIKIKIESGEKIVGQFVIVDSNTIAIKGRHFSLNDIVKMRKASTFTAFTTPISITLGGVLATSGIALLSFAGSPVAALGAIPLFYGALFIVVPLTAKKHHHKKWNYKIEN